MATFSMTVRLLASEDPVPSNNPLVRPIERTRIIAGASVDLPGGQPYHVPGLSSLVVFDGTRTLGVDGTTQFALTNLDTVDPSRYRLAWTGTGTAPVFRTARSVTLTGGSLTLVVNPNRTVAVTHTGGAVFGAVVAGDYVRVPGASTGDTSHFNALNEGTWVVIQAAASQLVMVRPPEQVFQGFAETVAVGGADWFQVYSSAGVQVGDTLLLGAGFAPTTRRAYRVADVTAGAVEFVSTDPVAEETLVPGATAVQVYSNGKRFVYTESDQSLAVRYNDCADNSNRLDPLVPGDENMPAVDLKFGAVYRMELVNLTTSTARVYVATAV